MLSESMNNMQQQMSGAACSNPKKSGKGEGSKPMDKISEGQKGMKESMQKMMGYAAAGQEPDPKSLLKPLPARPPYGKHSKKYKKDMQQHGEKTNDIDKIIDGMDKIETDLVNKKLTNEMMKRQEEILTRLLEAKMQIANENKMKKKIGNRKKNWNENCLPSLQEYLKTWSRDRSVQDSLPMSNHIIDRLSKIIWSLGRTDHATNNK